MKIILKPQYGGKLHSGKDYYEYVLAFTGEDYGDIPRSPLFVLHVDWFSNKSDPDEIYQKMFYEGVEVEAEINLIKVIE